MQWSRPLGGVETIKIRFSSCSKQELELIATYKRYLQPVCNWLKSDWPSKLLFIWQFNKNLHLIQIWWLQLSSKSNLTFNIENRPPILTWCHWASFNHCIDISLNACPAYSHHSFELFHRDHCKHPNYPLLLLMRISLYLYIFSSQSRSQRISIWSSSSDVTLVSSSLSPGLFFGASLDPSPFSSSFSWCRLNLCYRKSSCSVFIVFL